jgi:hypothetical protein
MLYNKLHEISLRFVKTTFINSKGGLNTYIYCYYDNKAVLKVYENGTYKVNEE